MSHQVLARKWRPRAFDALVGQDHVVRALSHALETGRLHHAYLFTGTRGVGKTTIARILAKAVNCELGMSPKPCGECSACQQIDQGGFVDYLELDAASNRGVDEMVHILDNAVYAPTAGRYKVYVIDEVHMLTAHAFNAMLKTLEEPPPHMLFILATTDPQKVPVTVLSRCMQLNLRNMQPQAIAGHLATVLDSEKIKFDQAALELIGRAAAGSMRDALSLTDQAIAAGAGSVAQDQVRDMLGMIDSGFVRRVLDALSTGDGPALVDIADELAETPESGNRLLSDLATQLADLAAGQHVSSAQQDGDQAFPNFDAPALQVYYQIAIYGQRDLPLAPDPRAGLVMTLLRMLAFSGEPADTQPDAPPPAASSTRKVGGAAAARAALAGNQGASTTASTAKAGPGAGPLSTDPQHASGLQQGKRPLRADRSRSTMEKLVAGELPGRRSQPASQAVATPQVERQATATPGSIAKSDDMSPEPPPLLDIAGESAAAGAIRFDGDWPALARRLALTGRPGQFMMQSQLEKVDGPRIHLRVPIAQLAEKKLVERVTDSLKDHLADVRLSVRVGPIDGGTAAIEVESERQERLIQARASLEADPFVKTLINDFDAMIVPESIRAVDGASLNRGENT